jgi:hypothetical protein
MIQGDAVAGSIQFRTEATSGSTESDAGQNWIVGNDFETPVALQSNRLGISLSVSSDLQ